MVKNEGFSNYTDEELKRLREHDLSLIKTLRKERKSMMEDIKIITLRKKSVREELIKRGMFKK
ncbi:Uncharacterised protein [Sebaldella termitidis]|uniref:Uncharacterized protein n=1 Tax=Sebaldella termitidis (strain ATCC 33386 / NCTC 11300) TaxID=526218 RepID=D1AGM1_SEBTE|nr:hypothetical protein [Sebaldella termitidis]ACZ10741.1 hypothetical protein Sterm_3908 [Sebaldella termitidis ATCC 33386]SUI26084.1 Uncharacterised protein [Sebaldella termitidis]